jgi:hypothetical protein
MPTSPRKRQKKVSTKCLHPDEKSPQRAVSSTTLRTLRSSAPLFFPPTMLEVAAGHQRTPLFFPPTMLEAAAGHQRTALAFQVQHDSPLHSLSPACCISHCTDMWTMRCEKRWLIVGQERWMRYGVVRWPKLKQHQKKRLSSLAHFQTRLWPRRG